MSEPEQPAASTAADPSAEPSADTSAATPPTADAHSGDDGDTADAEPEADDFGPPFTPKTFGGAFVWAKGDGFVTTVLRVKEGKSVPVATQNRRDMHVMLTGGRAVLEVDDGNEVDRVELMPAGPLLIDPANRYRLIAMTEVEIFTVYTQV
ncbi:MAG: hypothetical protein ACE37F_12545 [Nannocystaceae bacterium]|nr:hypothetical protein [bacterium]